MKSQNWHLWFSESASEHERQPKEHWELAIEVNVKRTKKANIALKENDFLFIISLCSDWLNTTFLKRIFNHKTWRQMLQISQTGSYFNLRGI
jgi:hypothetical protein